MVFKSFLIGPDEVTVHAWLILEEQSALKTFALNLAGNLPPPHLQPMISTQGNLQT